MITKTQTIAGGVVVLGAVATTGGILGTRKVSDRDEISLMVLNFEKEFNNNYTGTGNDEQIGKKYGWYLVGTYGVSSTSENHNEKWWNWSYNRWRSDLNSDNKPLSEEFQDKTKVGSGFSASGATGGNVDKALNKVCERVYKKKVVDVEFKLTADDTKSKLGRDLLRYCSPLSEKPLTIKEWDKKIISYGSEDFGKIHEGDLIEWSYGKVGNDEFWISKNDEFFGKKDEDGAGNGLDSSKDSLFYNLYAKKGQEDVSEGVRKKCLEAYKEKKTSTKVKEETLLKFCTFNYKPQTSK